MRRASALQPALVSFDDKRCCMCKQWKPLEAFYLVRRGSTERAAQCRICQKKIKDARNANGKEAAYYSSPKRRRALLRGQLRRKFGVSIEEYEGWMEAQAGLCAICGQPETARPAPMKRPGGIPVIDKRLAVDHDHVTGRVRGLLCGGCNAGIGHFRDDPSILRLAAIYLESH